MRGKKNFYTFVIEYLGGTYVRQAAGESPSLALCAWLRNASDEDFDLELNRKELLEAVEENSAVSVEGCRNVWCMSGVVSDNLFLIHIIGTDPGSSGGKLVAEEQYEKVGVDPKRWGWGDRW